MLSLKKRNISLTSYQELRGAEPIQVSRALAPSARSMKELEANRLHLRQRRQPKEEIGEEIEAEKDQGPFIFCFLHRAVR